MKVGTLAMINWRALLLLLFAAHFQYVKCFNKDFFLNPIMEFLFSPYVASTLPLVTYARDPKRLTEVSASDKLEEFRASKEVVVLCMWDL